VPSGRSLGGALPRLRAHENPAQGMGFGRRLSGVPKSLGGTLGLGSVGGTPEGIYDGMPFIGTLQARAAF